MTRSYMGYVSSLTTNTVAAYTVLNVDFLLVGGGGGGGSASGNSGGGGGGGGFIEASGVVTRGT